MGKLHNDISVMLRNLKVIEQYNNFKQLGEEDDIKFLKNKINNLYNITESEKLIKEFNWCSKMINLFYDAIDPDFKIHYLKEERIRNLRE